MNGPDPPRDALAGPPNASSPGSDAPLLTTGLLPPRQPGYIGSIGDYDIIRLLGVGGMGAVFLATPASGSGCPVALKLLKPELMNDPRARDAFFKETAHLQKLAHPGILPVLEIQQDSRPPYFVMPYLEGGCLAEQFKGGRLPPEDILGIAKMVGSVLSYIHAKGRIHQDLKPANILLDRQGRAYVADFGLARNFFNDSVINWQQELPVGTAPYMSPATAAGEKEDTRGDIYSFGALLYEMLTGRPPYEGKSTREIIQQILAGPPRPIREINPEAPEHLVHVAETAMARDLKDRYADMKGVLADLEGGYVPTRAASKRRWKTVLPVSVLAALALVALAFFTGHRGGKDVSNEGASPMPQSASHSAFSVVASLRKPSIWRWKDAQLGDWDGDGELELFVLTENRFLNVVSLDGQIMAKEEVARAEADDLALDWVRDLDGDRRDELFVSWRLGAETIISVKNQSFIELKRFLYKGVATKVRPANRRYGSVLTPVLLEDINGDGKLELVAIINTGLEKGPRALVCFSFETQQVQWAYPTAPLLSGTVYALDMNSDGQKEIVFTGSAPCNTNAATDGTDDFHAYLFALNNNGQLLWKKELGDERFYAIPVVAQPKRGGQPFIGAWTTAEAEARHEFRKEAGGEIFSFASDGSIVGRCNIGKPILTCLATDVAETGILRILATDLAGTLYCLDSRLNLMEKHLLQTNPHDGVRLRLVDVKDINGDGRNEIVLQSSQVQRISKANLGPLTQPPTATVSFNSCIFLLDSKLNRLANYTIADKLKNMPNFTVYAKDIDHDGKAEMICLTDEALILRWKGVP